MMKTKFGIFAMSGLALGAGCNRGATNSSVTNNTAAAAPTAAPAAVGVPVTQASLVGTWGQDNCTNTISFRPDGSFSSTTAKQGDNSWSLDGGTVVMSSPGVPAVRMAGTISDQGLHLNTGGAAGQTAIFARCATEEGAAPATRDSENEVAEEAVE
jgi:hypothetical protein